MGAAAPPAVDMMNFEGPGVARGILRNIVYLARGSLLAMLAVVFLFHPALSALRPIIARFVHAYLPASIAAEEDRAVFVALFVLAHETIYFGYSGLLLLDEHTLGLLTPYQLPRKPHEIPTRGLIIKSIAKTVTSHATAQPVALWFFYPILVSHGMVLDGPLPDWRTMTLHLAAAQFTEALLFFTVHRTLHIPALYKRFHKQHHEYKGTLVFSSEYSHPVESALGNYVPFILAPLLLGTHFAVLVTWLWWRLIATYERHSGYCYQGTLASKLGLTHSYLELFHDQHHLANMSNYGSGLDIFDVLLGTRTFPHNVLLKGKKGE